MLAQIGDFTFKVNDTAYDSFKRSIKYKYSTMQRIGTFDDYQSVGKYEESIELNGILITKSQSQLDAFEKIAQDKKAKTLAFANGRCESVIITSLEMDRSSFLKDGAFLKQSFKIGLKVVGGGL